MPIAYQGMNSVICYFCHLWTKNNLFNLQFTIASTDLLATTRLQVFIDKKGKFILGSWSYFVIKGQLCHRRVSVHNRPPLKL